jgi:hypothetical protein
MTINGWPQSGQAISSMFRKSGNIDYTPFTDDMLCGFCRPEQKRIFAMMQFPAQEMNGGMHEDHRFARCPDRLWMRLWQKCTAGASLGFGGEPQ